MHLTTLDAASPSWSAEIERLYTLLGGAANPALFPSHFLQAVLTRISGQVVLAGDRSKPQLVGFLFPRHKGHRHKPTRCYTLRYHRLDHALIDLTALREQLTAHLNAADVTLYDPLSEHSYHPTHHWMGIVDIGHPDHVEADAIRTLQQTVWGSPAEFLYPADIHSAEFAMGTSLVARLEGKAVGFLFGFAKFGGYPLPADWQNRFHGDLRLESQALGVLPEYRGARLGFLLKQLQAEQALAAGVQLVNWTVDPLQWPNALLNFGLLRALAFDFVPDYYPFRNELNRVAASRFSLTWLPGTARVQQALQHAAGQERPQAQRIDLAEQPAIHLLNDGWQLLEPPHNTDRIAIEIPADWTTLQRDKLDEAMRWRATTDALFARYIGQTPGQYVVTNVGVDGARRYLLADRVVDGLWERLLAERESP